MQSVSIVAAEPSAMELDTAGVEGGVAVAAAVAVAAVLVALPQPVAAAATLAGQSLTGMETCTPLHTDATLANRCSSVWSSLPYVCPAVDRCGWHRHTGSQ